MHDITKAITFLLLTVTLLYVADIWIKTNIFMWAIHFGLVIIMMGAYAKYEIVEKQ